MKQSFDFMNLISIKLSITSKISLCSNAKATVLKKMANLFFTQFTQFTINKIKTRFCKTTEVEKNLIDF